MRVLGIAGDFFAVLDTDGRAIEAFGPAGPLDSADWSGVELIGLEQGDAERLARRTGLPVACDFGSAGPAVYYRALARMSGLERPVAIVDGGRVIHIAENGLLSVDDEVGDAHTVVRNLEEVGWPGEALQAQAVAFLAARVWNGFPIAFPGTTGAPYPMAGGRIVRP